MADKKYVVTAPCVVLKLEDGAYASPLYEGAPVPAEQVDKDHLQHLIDSKLIGETEQAAQDESRDPNKAPAKSASKADWVAYATDEARGEQRMSAEDADAATRDDLAARFTA